MDNLDFHEIFKQKKLENETGQNIIRRRLAEVFETYQKLYGVSIAEFADGLGINRGAVRNFMSDPVSNSLDQINRASLLNLWFFVTHPEQYKHRRLQQKQRDARSELKAKGPNELLEAVEFKLIQENTDELTLPVPVARAITRLSSRWIEDEVLREYIINNVIDNVLDQGRLDREFYIDPLNYVKDKSKIYRFPIDLHLTDHPYIQVNNLLKGKLLGYYEDQIDVLARSGKTEFSRSELFELFQSILEHTVLHSSDQRVILSDCEFETVSPLVSIFDTFEIQHSRNATELDFFDGKSLTKYQNDAELKISVLGSFGDYHSQENIESSFHRPRLIKAKVTCLFLNSQSDSSDKTEAYFENISTSTHIENMMSAIKSGLGYDTEISGFFIRATGRTSQSLARVSLSLKDKSTKNVYQGWWVTSSTILGILRATGDAFIRYISSTPIDKPKYYLACNKIAKIENEVYKNENYIYEGESHLREGNRDIKSVYTKIIEDIYSLKKAYKEELNNKWEKDYYCSHRLKLNHLINRIRLVAFHASLIAVDLKEASKYIDDFKNEIIYDITDLSGQEDADLEEDPDRIIISLQKLSSFMRYKLIVGDREFLSGANWRKRHYDIPVCFDLIKKYNRVIGGISSSSYFCAAQVVGIRSQLELYCEKSSASRRALEIAVGNLIEAAYYSSRIGHLRRSAQWIINAARICCRLGSSNDIDVAKKLIELSRWIIENIESSKFPVILNTKLSDISSSDLCFSDMDSPEWLEINTYIVNGEIKLSCEQYHDAFLLFFIALRSIYKIGYNRILPDCLYNMGRCLDHIGSSEYLSERKLVQLTQNSFPRRYEILNNLDKDQEGNHYFSEETHRKIINIINKDNLTLEGKIDCKEFSDECKNAAKSLLNDWARYEGYQSHYFSESIDDGSFLASLNNV